MIGASRRQSNLGRRVLDSLTACGFQGEIYAVNPAASELAGRRCHASVRNLPAGIDLAVIAVPRDAVLPTVDDCASIGVKGLVIISAGFAEADSRGRELQTELVERVRGYGMRMVGPNCMGIINNEPSVRLNASFADRIPAHGGITLASQSGGLGLAVLELAARRQLGLSTFVSLGNKADISGNDLLQYAEQDPRTSVVLLYLESLGNPRRFGQLARRVSRTKPIVVVKAGRTAAGSRAAASHTAGLAASELAIDGLFQQAGVIRADTIDELFDIATCLDLQPLPRGRRVAILTNAGGPGILAADACVGAGLEVPATCGGRSNPCDLIASAGADAYRRALKRCSRPMTWTRSSRSTPPSTGPTPHRFSRAFNRWSPAIASAAVPGNQFSICTVASPDTPSPSGRRRNASRFRISRTGARALGKVAAYASWRATPPGGSLPFEPDAST